MQIFLVNTNDLSKFDKEYWINWLKEETDAIEDRFGDDVPKNYYELMEIWWIKSIKEFHTTNKILSPIELNKNGNIYTIEDGFHRLAISIKNNIKKIPATIYKHKRN